MEKFFNKQENPFREFDQIFDPAQTPKIDGENRRFGKFLSAEKFRLQKSIFFLKLRLKSLKLSLARKMCFPYFLGYVETGASGTPVQLIANYFKLHQKPSFALTQYRVDFAPDIDLTQKRKQLIALNKEKFGGRYIFDGASLYLGENLSDFEFQTEEFESKIFTITIRKTGSVNSTDPEAFQIYNLIFRDAMSGLKLQNVKRDYYDPQAKVRLTRLDHTWPQITRFSSSQIDVPEGRLELWPGYITSIRAHHGSVLMNAEISHKFMRNETIMDIMKQTKNNHPHDWKDKLQKEIVGTTVLTGYTNKTYRIDSFDFSMTPKSTFSTFGSSELISYAQYYKQRYNIDIKDLGQPLLVSKARERDIRAGQPELIYLIPELARATGMTDEMRSNFPLMQQLSEHTRMNPEKRVKALKRFNNRIQSTPESVKVLREWGMKLDSELLEVEGRGLPVETICFNNQEVQPNPKGEWMIRDGISMYKAVDVKRWICMFPETMRSDAETFMVELTKAHKTMNCQMVQPRM